VGKEGMMALLKRLWSWFVGLFRRTSKPMEDEQRFFWNGAWWKPLTGKVARRKKEDKHTKRLRKIADQSRKINRQRESK